EIAGCPDFVHETETWLPDGRQPRQFPGPVTDNAASTNLCAAQGARRMRHIRAIVMHDQAAASGGQSAPMYGLGKFRLAERATQVECGRRKPCGIERCI